MERMGTESRMGKTRRARPRTVGQALPLVLLISLLVPGEARLSGAAHGTITRSSFEVIAVWGPRIHFVDSASERSHHDEERRKIEAALKPLADRIETFIDGLKAKAPWREMLQPYAPTDPGVSLAMFEQAGYADMLADIQAKGPYLYQTAFSHGLPGHGQASVRVRVVLSGKPSLADLYALEDGLFVLRTPMPADERYRANAQGIALKTFDCDKHTKKLTRIRAELVARLEAGGLMYRGHELEGSLFTASLEGPGLCRVDLSWLMAGGHHWGRTGAALIAAVQAVFPEARPWPGFPQSKEADAAPWRIVIPPPPD